MQQSATLSLEVLAREYPLRVAELLLNQYSSRGQNTKYTFWGFERFVGVIDPETKEYTTYHIYAFSLSEEAGRTELKKKRNNLDLSEIVLGEGRCRGSYYWLLTRKEKQ